MIQLVVAVFTIIYFDAMGATIGTETLRNVEPNSCVSVAYALAEQLMQEQIDGDSDTNFWVTCNVDGADIYVAGIIPPGVAIPQAPQ